MAQKVITEFIDDIDGTVAERTFTFAIDGTNYATARFVCNDNGFNRAYTDTLIKQMAGKWPSAA